MAAGLSVMAQRVASLLFGDGFHETGVLLAWMAWVLPFRFVNHLYGVVLASSGSRRITFVSGALGFNLVVSLSLIPAWGPRGALIGVLATEILLTGFLLWGILPLRAPMKGPLSEAALVSILVVAGTSLTPGATVVRLVVGIALGALSLTLLLGRPSLGLTVHRASPNEEEQSDP